jgi:hypothetical protein
MIGGFKPNNIKKPHWYSVIITQCKLEALRFAVQHDESFVDTFCPELTTACSSLIKLENSPELIFAL